MKIVLLIAIFVTFTSLGVYIYMHYRNRRRFFSDMLSFLAGFQIELNFSKNIISQVIERNHKNYSKHFRDVLTGYGNLIEGKCDITKDSLSSIMWNRLKPHESSAVTHFFYELGRHSVSEEIEKIASATALFNSMHAEACEKQKREASIYLKLCIILGLVTVILLI